MAGVMARVSLAAACATLFVQLWGGAHLERALVAAGLMAGAVHVAQLGLVLAVRLAAHRSHTPETESAADGIADPAPADTSAESVA